MNRTKLVAMLSLVVIVNYVGTIAAIDDDNVKMALETIEELKPEDAGLIELYLQDLAVNADDYQAIANYANDLKDAASSSAHVKAIAQNLIDELKLRGVAPSPEFIEENE